MASNRSHRLAKDLSRARLSGGIFELRMAGLVNARLRALRRRRPDLQLRFDLATNVEGANPFDDIVLHICWLENGQERDITYFIQLKHTEKADKPVSLHELTSDITKKRNDFRLRKYFEFLDRLKEISQKDPSQLDSNEQLLRKWTKGEYRLVLFTTRDVLPMARNNRASNTFDFPFEEVFHTQGEAFSFGQTDSKIWNMYSKKKDEDEDEDENENEVEDEDEDEEEFREVFLKRLRVFSAQAQVALLEPLLSRALEDTLEKSPPRPDWTLARYSAFLLRWWDSEDGDCLTEETTEIEEIVREDLHEQLQDLRFQPRYYEALQERIGSCSVAYIVVQGISSKLRSSMIRKALERSNCNRFVVLTEEAFHDYSVQTLENVCSKLGDEIILCLDSLDEQTEKFINNLLENRKCNVRVTSSRWNKEINEMLQFASVKWNIWTERWTLAQLEEPLQWTLLRRIVTFQGHGMALSALGKAWPTLCMGVCEETLGDLVEGKTITLGAALQNLDHFVHRTLVHQTILNRSIFQIRSSRDAFVLLNFPDDELQNIRELDSWEETSTKDKGISNQPHLQRERNIFLGQRKKSSEVRTKWSISQNEWNTNTYVNVHYLSFENGAMLWDNTRGKPDIIHEHVNKLCKRCLKIPKCHHKHLNDFIRCKERTLFLSASAGTGKSVFLTKMSHAIKTQRKFHWVLVVRMGEGKVIENSNDNMKNKDVLDILTYFAAPKHLATQTVKHFLRECIERSGYITVLVDAVDEVCPSHKERALKFVTSLQRLLKIGIGNLWVASRTVLEKDLACKLDCSTPLSLLPFSPQQQQRYLLNIWQDRLRGVTKTEQKTIVGKLVNVLREATKSGTSSLCDVPLYTRMLANIYEAEDLENILKEERNIPVNRYSLYKQFVMESLVGEWSKLGLSKSDLVNYNIFSKILNKPSEYGALVCFRDRNILGKHYDTLVISAKELNNDFERQQIIRNGLISFVQNTPAFFHRTMAEYLAAVWLKENHHSLYVLKYNMYRGVKNVMFSEVRYFLDALLAEGHPLHEAAMSGRREAVEEALRQEGQDVDAEDAGGRRALHLAAFYGHESVVRVLLEYGANVNKKDNFMSRTPFEYAACPFNTFNFIRYYFEEEIIQSFKVIEQLLRSGAKATDDLSIWNDKQCLLRACKNDYYYIVQKIITSQVHKFTSQVATECLSAAVYWGSINVVEILLKQHYLETYPEVDSLLFIMSLAASRDHAEVVGLMLQYGFSINNSNLTEILLHVCTPNGNFSVCHLLIERGANPNAATIDGNTALHIASHLAHKEICCLLIDAGTHVNARNKKRYTPLHALVNPIRLDYEEYVVPHANNGLEPVNIFRRLLSRETKTEDHKRVVNVAPNPGHEEICLLLLKAGVEVNAQNEEGNTAFHVLMKEICNLHWIMGKTLCLESECKLERICNLLVDYGADVNMKNARGETVLHVLVAESMHQLNNYLWFSYDCSRNNIKNEEFILQTRRCLLRVLRLLLERGAANQFIVNMSQEIVFDVACEKGLHDVCDILRTHAHISE